MKFTDIWKHLHVIELHTVFFTIIETTSRKINIVTLTKAVKKWEMNYISHRLSFRSLYILYVYIYVLLIFLNSNKILFKLNGNMKIFNYRKPADKVNKGMNALE